MRNLIRHNKFLLFIGLAFLSMLSGVALAAPDIDSSYTLGSVANQVTGSFRELGMLMIAGCYIGGFGLVCASMFKFKAHKDNPTQVPLGTPVALFSIGVLLAFLPAILSPAGVTIFGDKTVAGGFRGEGVSAMYDDGAPDPDV